MEILKKGNIERKWKFACEICRCEFVLDTNDMATPFNFCVCPTCGNMIKKDTGEVYEQLPHSIFKEDDIDRLLKEKAVYQYKEKENNKNG